MSAMDTRLAYVPRDERDAALVRRVIELTVSRWPAPSAEVTLTGLVREYLGDGLFALEVVRSDSSRFDLMTLVDNDAWQTTETGAAWVQVDDDGTLAVAYELDHDALGGAQMAEYPPIVEAHPFIPGISADAGDELLSVADLAKHHGIPYQTIASARLRGTLPARRVGRDWATTQAAFETWMASRKRERGEA